MIDRPDRPSPRFPAGREGAVASAVGAALDHWEITSGALLICGGARGADIIAAEEALARDAEVWLLIAQPEQQHIAASVELPDSDWVRRYQSLRRRCRTWFQADELPPLQAGDDAFGRNNDWSLRAGIAQARPGAPCVLAVWDGAAGDGRGGTAHLLERARSLKLMALTIHPFGGEPG